VPPVPKPTRKPKAAKTQKKRKPIRSRSKKVARLYRNYRVPLVKEILEERPLCQRCGRQSQDVHELVPRGRGGSIVDKENCVAL